MNVFMLLTVGTRPVTLIMVGDALTATLMSRLIYQGRSDPMMEETKGKASDEVK